jgi:hypothetical protein
LVTKRRAKAFMREILNYFTVAGHSLLALLKVAHYELEIVAKT